MILDFRFNSRSTDKLYVALDYRCISDRQLKVVIARPRVDVKDESVASFVYGHIHGHKCIAPTFPAHHVLNSVCQCK